MFHYHHQCIHLLWTLEEPENVYGIQVKPVFMASFYNNLKKYRSSPCYLLHVILNFRTIPLAINFKHFHFLWWNIILVEYILSYQIRKSLIDHSCKILSTEQFVLTCSTKRAGPLRYHEYSILLYQGIDSCFDWRHDDAL